MNGKTQEPMRSLDFMDLLAKGITARAGGLTYLLMAYDEYEDRIEMEYTVSTDEAMTSFDVKAEDVKITLLREDGKRFYEFACSGNVLSWDNEDLRFVSKPEVAEEEWKAINPWVSVAGGIPIRLNKDFAEHCLEKEELAMAVEYDEYYEWDTTGNSHFEMAMKVLEIFNGKQAMESSSDMVLEVHNMLAADVNNAKALRVEKEYAEHNLSEDCLAYGVYDPEKGYYIWSIEDHRALPAFLELRSLFNWEQYDENGKLVSDHVIRNWCKELTFFCISYCEKHGIEYEITPELLEKVMNLQKKELWEPGKE